jgi:hypothetical protein
MERLWRWTGKPKSGVSRISLGRLQCIRLDSAGTTDRRRRRTLWNRVLLEKPAVPHLVWNFLIFKKKTKFIFIFTRDCHSLQSWNRPMKSTPSYFLEMQFNIIRLSMPRSSKWSVPFMFPYQKPVFTSAINDTCYIPAHLDLHYITGTTSVEQYRSWGFALRDFLQYPVKLPSPS